MTPFVTHSAHRFRRFRAERIAVVIVLLGSVATGCRGTSNLPFQRPFAKETRRWEMLSPFEKVPAQAKLFRTKDEWLGFWQQLAIEPPQVDLSASFVAAVFGGQRPSSGYSIQIQQLAYHPERKHLVIIYSESRPTSELSAGVLTHPQDYAVFDRRDDIRTVEARPTETKPKGQ